MGSSQSSKQIIEKHPQIRLYDQIIESILIEQNNEGNTISLIHKQFHDQLNYLQNKQISRQHNPFCPLIVGNNMNWLTGCFISPFMIIANPLFILNQEGKLKTKITAKPVYNGKQLTIKVLSAIQIQKLTLCILLLNQPYYNNGWAGMSSIKSLQNLHDYNLKMINHPEYYLDRNINTMVYSQFIAKYQLNQLNFFKQHLMAVQYNSDITGSFVFKLVKQKPYIIGIQASESQTIFFKENTIKNIQKAALRHIKQTKFNCKIDVLYSLRKGLFHDDQIQ